MAGTATLKQGGKLLFYCLLLFIAGVLLLDLAGDPFPGSRWLGWLNALGLVGVVAYEWLFKRKKRVVINGKMLEIHKGNQVIREIDLSRKPRITRGLRSVLIRIEGEDLSLSFREFDEESAALLRAL